MKALKRHLRYFSRVRSDLLWLLALSFVTYTSIEIASAWPSSSYGIWQLGRGFSVLAMAYVTAFIFYYFVNHIQEEKDRELLSLIALQPLKHIQSGNDIILGYVMGSESYKTEGLSFEEIKEVVRKMDVNKVIDFGSKDAPQDMTIKDSLEMWYAMAHEWINEILGYGLKIDPEILSLLHILRQHTEKDFKYVEGILGTDKNIVNRYRIAEVAYFTNVVLERLKRYPQTYHHRDDEFNQAINRNRGRAIQKLDEFLKKRAQGDIELEQD